MMALQGVFHKFDGRVSTANVHMKFLQSGNRNRSKNKLLNPAIIAPQP